MARKITEASFTRSYDFLRLDRRDIQQILDILSTEGQPVEIVSDGYAYDSVTELAEHFGMRRVTEMRITGGGVRVSLEKASSSIIATFFGQDASASLAKCFAVDRLLSARRRFLNGPFISFGQIVGAVIFVCGVAALTTPGVSLQRKLAFTAPLVLVGALLLLLAASYKTALVLDEKHEPFVQRHKEKVVVGVITAVITAVTIFAGQRVYEVIAKPASSAAAPGFKP